MAFTKLYLNAAGPHTPIFTSSKQGTWDSQGPITSRRKMLTARNRDDTAIQNFWSSSETSAGDWRICLYEGISGPISAQTISGTVDVVAQVKESNLDADMHWYVHIAVLQGDTNTVRGTLLNNYSEPAGTNEWPATRIGIGFNLVQALTNVNAQDGDRIKCEIGCIARNTLTSSRSGQLYPGGGVYGTTTIDVVFFGSETNAVSFVQFSNSITTPSAPSNDSCSSPTVISSLPFTDNLNIEWATEDVSDPLPAFEFSPGEPIFCSVWYSFTPSTSGRYKFNYNNSDFVGNPSNTTLFGRMAIFTGSCGSLTEVVSHEGAGWVAIDLVASTTYLIMVGTSNGVGGNLVFEVEEVPAPYPTNISAEAATEVTTLPTTIIQDVTGTTGPRHTVWFKYTGKANEIVLSIHAWAQWTVESNEYLPNVTVWTGTPESLTEWLPSFQIENDGVPIVVPMVEGQVFYFEVKNFWQFNEVVEADLTIKFTQEPKLPVPVGSIIITDDTGGFPAVALDSSTGEVLRYLPTTGLPAGEYGLLLSDGNYVHEDIDSATLAHFVRFLDSQLNLVTSFELPTPSSNHYIAGMASDASGNVYIAVESFSASTTTTITKYSSAGVPTGETWTITGSDFNTASAMAVNPAGTILYYARSGSNGAPVKRYDLVGSVGLSDLAAAPSGYRPQFNDMHVLSDDTILVSWMKSTTPTNWLIRRYDASGTQLNEYNLGTPGIFTRFTPDPDSAYFWVWTQPLSGADRHTFRRISVSSGSIDRSFAIPGRFSQGEGVWGITDYPDMDMPLFGPSPSCPFLLSGEALGFEPPPVPEPPTGEPPGVNVDDTCPCVPGTGPVLPPDPYIPIPAWIASCGFGGLAPNGTDPSYAENWVLQ